MGTSLVTQWLGLRLGTRRHYGFNLWSGRWDPTELLAKKKKPKHKKKQHCNKFNKDFLKCLRRKNQGCLKKSERMDALNLSIII